MKIGYSLSSEETTPKDLVRYAVRAEQAGFSFALISDHFHPWLTRQGQSPFVWAVIGAIAQATNRIALGTGVTCPIMRIHPAIIAQAAATAALLMPDRFFLGLGTGENLNEHIFGMPLAAERRTAEDAPRSGDDPAAPLARRRSKLSGRILQPGKSTDFQFAGETAANHDRCSGGQGSRARWRNR